MMHLIGIFFVFTLFRIPNPPWVSGEIFSIHFEEFWPTVSSNNASSFKLFLFHFWNSIYVYDLFWFFPGGFSLCPIYPLFPCMYIPLTYFPCLSPFFPLFPVPKYYWHTLKFTSSFFHCVWSAVLNSCPVTLFISFYIFYFNLIHTFQLSGELFQLIMCFC